MIIDPTANLEKISNKIFYSPFAGGDIEDPILLFRDYLSEFWFVDCNYSFTADNIYRFRLKFSDFNLKNEEILGPKEKIEEIRTGTSCKPYRYIEPAALKREYLYNNRKITILFRRGFAYNSLFGPSTLNIGGEKLGIFFFRGTSPEGGSTQYWVYLQKQKVLDGHEPIYLVKKLISTLPDGGLIVTDGSNSSGIRPSENEQNREYYQFYRFHSMDISCEDAVKLAESFTDTNGFHFSCIGHAGKRNGPTLIWQIQK